MTVIWKLLKQFVRESEDANNVMFTDSAWQRVKKLEADIEAEIYRREQEIHEMYRELKKDS